MSHFRPLVSLRLLSALGSEGCHKMSSATANAARLSNDTADGVHMDTSTVMMTLYVMLNMRGFIRFVGLEGVERRLVKPEGALREDRRNPLPPPVLLTTNRS